jgi:hypothetical protein
MRTSATETITKGEGDLRDYIEILARVTDSQVRAGIQSPHRFMLEHGRTFAVTSLTFEGPRGVPRQCYSNAGQRALRGRKGLCYAEGYVTAFGLPIPHGWLVTPEGDVIDPTLKDSDEVYRVYFGLAFDRGYHRVAIMKGDRWSLLEHDGVALNDIIKGRTKHMLSVAHHQAPA